MTSAARLVAGLALAVGLLAGVAAGLGIFARGDGNSVLVASARGEVYEMATTGIYANNAVALVAEGVGWDIFTLVVAVPALCIGAWLTAKGSRRGTPFAAGMLGYFTYMYLEYSVTWAFGPLFPLFVAITALSVVGLIVAAALASEQAVRFSERFPRRSWAALGIGMAVLLIVLWTERIVAGLTAGSMPSLLGETTMTVQALDLGLVVPASIIIALGALIRRPAGLAAAAAFAVTFVAMSAAIASMMISSWIATGTSQLPPIVVFALSAAAGLVVGGRIYASAASIRPSHPSDHGAWPAHQPTVAET